MTRHRFAVCLARWIAALLVGACAGMASGQAPPPYVFSGPLLPLLLQMPENSWLHANANLYSNVWTAQFTRAARRLLPAAALEDHRGVERLCLG